MANLTVPEQRNEQALWVPKPKQWLLTTPTGDGDTTAHRLEADWAKVEGGALVFCDSAGLMLRAYAPGAWTEITSLAGDPS